MPTESIQLIEWPFPVYGLDTERHAKDAPAESLVTATNLYFQNPYMLRSRGGMDDTYDGDGSNDCVVMYYWEYDSKLYHADDAKHLYQNGTLKNTGAQNVTDMCSFGSGATPVLIVAENETGNASLHTWTGAAYATLTGTDVPRCRLVMSRWSRLFGTRNSVYPSRIFWSDAGDHTVWSGGFGEGGYIDVAAGDDGDIVDWIEYDGVLYVFKEGGIYRVLGDSTTSLHVQKLTETDQLLANTVADCGKGVLYATKSGVFPVGAARQAESYDLTRRVEADVQAFLASGARAAYSPEMGAYLLVNGSTTIWVSNHNSRPDVWTKFTAPTAMSSVYTGNGTWFGAVNGKVYFYDHDGYTDDAAAFTTALKTGHWNIGDYWKKKNVLRVDGLLNAGRNSTATVKLYADASGTATTAQGVSILTAALEQRVPYNFNCERVALEVAYTALSGPVYFGGARLGIIPLTDVG